MKCTTYSIRASLILGATLFAAHSVVAQPIRPAPPVPEQLTRSSPSNDSHTSAVAGTVKQYLMNPYGEVDGLLLNDATQIHFPPHMASALVADIQPGDQVTVEGDRQEGTPMIRGHAITNKRIDRTVVAHDPSRKDHPRPPHLRRLSLSAMEASGPLLPCSMRHAEKCMGLFWRMVRKSILGRMPATASCGAWR